jgi:hypothetical protein
MMHIEVRISNTDDDRVIRFETDVDDCEVTESHITGELSLRPGPKLHHGAGKMPKSKTPWRQYLEGDWMAKDEARC